MRKTKPLDQDILIGAEAHDHTTKVHNKLDPQGSIMERLMNFASSVPDFRRLSKGNIRHKLKDIIILMILARASKCVVSWADFAKELCFFARTACLIPVHAIIF